MSCTSSTCVQWALVAVLCLLRSASLVYKLSDASMCPSHHQQAQYLVPVVSLGQLLELCLHVQCLHSTNAVSSRPGQAAVSKSILLSQSALAA